MLQAKQCDSPLCCTSKARPPSRVHQAICSVVISARPLAVPRSTMAILWACVGGLVGPHLCETMLQGFRQNHPQQHPRLSYVHVLAVTPDSMLPSWWWNVINLNKPVFSSPGLRPMQFLNLKGQNFTFFMELCLPPLLPK